MTLPIVHFLLKVSDNLLLPMKGCLQTLRGLDAWSRPFLYYVYLLLKESFVQNVETYSNFKVKILGNFLY